MPRMLPVTEEQVKALREFVCWALQESLEGCDLDGGDIEGKAAKLGLVVPVLATAENKGVWEEIDFVEEGEEFFMLAPWLRGKDG